MIGRYALSMADKCRSQSWSLLLVKITGSRLSLSSTWHSPAPCPMLNAPTQLRNSQFEFGATKTHIEVRALFWWLTVIGHSDVHWMSWVKPVLLFYLFIGLLQLKTIYICNRIISVFSFLNPSWILGIPCSICDKNYSKNLGYQFAFMGNFCNSEIVTALFKDPLVLFSIFAGMFIFRLIVSVPVSWCIKNRFVLL